MGHRYAFASCVLGVAFAASCGSADDSTFAGGTSGSSGASGASGASGSGGFGSSGSSGASGTSGTSGGGGEVCDGVDNDGNGIIDDVDVGNDGICDCLRIATIGAPGKWGQGDVFAAWLNARSVKGAVALESKVLDRALLDQYQVIVAQDVSTIGRTYSAQEIAALGDWVKAGGGLLTLIGYADSKERANVNALLATFGMSYGSAGILPKNGGSTIPVKGWVAHPVTQGVAMVGVDNGYPVEGNGIALASEQGHTLLRAQEVGSGHALVWGDEWITYNSEWSGHPEYQVTLFWLNMIKWLTPAKECQVPIPANVK
jgi:hypothetical protein